MTSKHTYKPFDQRRGDRPIRNTLGLVLPSDLSDSKWCPRCNTTKPISRFGVNNKRKDKLSSACKDCHADIHRVRTYGVTKVQYEQMKLDQGNMCPICRKDFSLIVKPVIDHCHETGKVRSILCSPCNSTLGYIERDHWLDSALAYIKGHKG